RYTCIASALMMTPPHFSAISNASADLPLAVAPAMMRMVDLGMTIYVATLIANAPDYSLTSEFMQAIRTEIERLYDHKENPYEIPSPSLQWLKEGEACDVFFAHRQETLFRLKAWRFSKYWTAFAMMYFGMLYAIGEHYIPFSNFFSATAAI